MQESRGHAKILVLCPKCKEASYIRAELSGDPRKGWEVIEPDYFQECQVCGQAVELQKVVDEEKK
jgi:hypothetical protein